MEEKTVWILIERETGRFKGHIYKRRHQAIAHQQYNSNRGLDTYEVTGVPKLLERPDAN